MAFVEFARRLGDFAIAGAAAMLTIRDGVCETARLTIAGMGEGPFRAHDAEQVLTGRRLAGAEAQRTIAEAAASVIAAVDPADDVHASSAYRRHLAGVMAARALEAAVARRGGH
jgi:carbon-monoxide dehydrogenase medium subunit